MGATIPILDVNEEIFDDLVNVHFKRVYFLAQRCIPLLNEGGAIINISSGTTRFSHPGYSVYSSMKEQSRYLQIPHKRVESKENPHQCGGTCPVETDFNNASILNNPAMKAGLSAASSLNRVGKPDDIGNIVAFLCTDEAEWINGQRIEVSGGING